MVKLARVCLRHRRAVLLVWVVVLAGASVASVQQGARYVNNLTLPGKQSQQARDLLEAKFPAQSGDTDTIVLRAKRGRIADANVRAAAAPMLARVARLPHVASVGSPYAPGRAGQVSRDGRIAFAALNFDRQANDLPKPAIERVIATAERARSDRLQVELGGQAIQVTQQTPPAATEAIGLLSAIVVLLLTFGSLVAMGLPILTALFGLGTALALIGLLSQVVDTADFSPQLAAMIGLGVGIDYALFIVTRFRDAYRESGGDVERSVAIAMDTAGRAVLFAGATVVIALLGMMLLGVDFLYGVALAASLGVLLTMIASLTLTPALLGFAGRRIGEGTRRARRKRAQAAPDRVAPWLRWSEFVRRHPLPCAIVATLILAVLTAPALSLRLGTSDAGSDPRSTTTRNAYDLLATGFGAGFNGPLLLVARVPADRGARDLAGVSAAVRATDGVAAVAPPRFNAARDAATIAVYPATAPDSEATDRLVQRLRERVVPPAARQAGLDVYVGGITAAYIDLADTFAAKLPLFIGVVVLLSALLLLLVFRSWLIPLQAAFMNLLSIGASLGLVVAVFQHGWLGGIGGIEPGPVEAFLPVMLFAIVFGLSMDYEVFLVARIREEWSHHRDSSRAVAEGLAATGRVITAAATIMVLVFGSFMLGNERVIQLFGLGLASAVFLDAFLIRVLLLPAVLDLCGDATWRLPAWLDRLLPNVSIEGTGTRNLAEITVTARDDDRSVEPAAVASGAAARADEGDATR